MGPSGTTPTGNLQLITFRLPSNLSLFTVLMKSQWFGQNNNICFIFLIFARSFGIFYTKFKQNYIHYQKIGTFKQNKPISYFRNPNLLGQLAQSATGNFTYSIVDSATSLNATILQSSLSVINRMSSSNTSLTTTCICLISSRKYSLFLH